MKKILNPISIITLQVIYYLFILNIKFKGYSNRINIIVISSYILFILGVIIINNLYKVKPKKNISYVINNKDTYNLLCIINYIEIFLFVFALIRIFKTYGGVTSFILSYNFNLIRDIQSNYDTLTSYALIFLYINPLIITIIVDKLSVIKNRYNKKMVIASIYINILLVLALSLVLGARITLLYTILTLIIYKKRNIKINFKNAIKFIIPIFMIMAMILYSQNIRNRNMGDAEISNMKSINILSNYYDKSIINSINVIDNQENSGRTKGYWTLKTTFNLPKVGPIINKIYNNYIGDNFITTREQEFTYISSLGLDPMYNTLGIYGYQYLDWGMFSIVTISMQYIIAYVLYKKFCSTEGITSFIFPVVLITLIDQLRTNGLVSSFVVYSIYFYLLLKLFDIIIDNIRIRKLSYR